MPSSNQSVIVSGTGAYAPDRVVTNHEMARIVDTSDEWIRTRTGIVERRFAAEEETCSDMAVVAAERAIEAAGIVDRNQIDLLIVATMTPDMPVPATACLVQHKLGLEKVTAFDVQAACSGYLYVLNIAASMISSGSYKKALIIGAEKMSSILDFEDRNTCVLFGDASSAAILEPGTDNQAGILGHVAGADGSKAELLYQPAGGSACPPCMDSINARQHFIKMNGREVFKLAVRSMEETSSEVLKQSGYGVNAVDLVIPHQANMRIIDSFARNMGLPIEKIYNNLDRFGNTSAASVGLALDEALRNGRIRSGNLVLLVAFGAGLTWGASLIKWQ